MKKILICNQKGGVGKSLIADELAFSFERSNIPLAFLDLDNQGGTIHKTDRNEDAEVAIVDTPGALQSKLKDWLADADVIVVPTRTTSRDIEPLQRMQRAILANVKPGTPVLYVLNGWNRWRASHDFLEWFMGYSQQKPESIQKLPQSEQFVQAGAAGMSVVTYAKSPTAASRATLELCNSVRQAAGFAIES